ncbi:MAG: phage tail sheath family protein [Roseiflexaceae bacterium]
MPEYLSPGVYIQEVNSGPRPIEGVGTAMAAFIGFAPYGKANTPVLITNWSQYLAEFGTPKNETGDPIGPPDPHRPGWYLSHAVYGYFLNGGGRCYVTRIVPPGSQEEKRPELRWPSRTSKDVPSLTFVPKDASSKDIRVEVAPPTGENPPENSFTLKISSDGVEETYENVTFGRRSPKNVVDAVNQQSKLVMVADAQAAGSIADRVPQFGNEIIKAGQTTSIVAVKSQDFIGNAAERTGVEGMEIAEDVTMVCCPDLMSPTAYKDGVIDKLVVKAVQEAMITHCERMADRMVILDPLPNLSPQEVAKWRQDEARFNSKFATLYYPWITVMGPDNKPIAVPPCGHIAGIWARNDNERGVHKAPANEPVRGILDVAAPITKGEQDILNPIGVNCIRSFTGRGPLVWGARTLSADPAWRYVNVRRLFNYVEKSIERGTQWVVFEPNDPDLWARVRRDVGAFLTGVWREGMLFGRTPEEAFYVKCDEELNPSDVRDRGQLIIEIGLAPVKPAEFVIFRFSQWAGGGS